MKHYFNPMSRALTTHWMLTELNAEHEQVMVDFEAGDSRSAEFRAINPMGKVPTLVDDGVVVTEVAAICAYLADKYPEKGFAPPSTLPSAGATTDICSFPAQRLNPCSRQNLSV